MTVVVNIKRDQRHYEAASRFKNDFTKCFRKLDFVKFRKGETIFFFKCQSRIEMRIKDGFEKNF